MEKKLVLVGTSHEFQFGVAAGCTSAEVANFKDNLARLAELHGAKAIAEEMSLAALRHRYELSCSATYTLAMDLGLRHRYCEPDPEEQAALGIEEEGAIRLMALPPLFGQNWSSEQVATGIRGARSLREREWVRRLLDLNAWPTIFVCGALHVSSVRQLLEKSGVSVVVADENWGGREIQLE
jgi:hypothetical protein